MTSAEQAERIFTRVFKNLTSRHVDMLTFQRLADLGKPAAIAKLHQEQLELAHDIENNPAYDEFFKDRRAVVEFFGGPEKMATMTASQEIKKYSRIVDATLIVFVHGALDAAISDLCRVTLLLDPSAWEPYVLATKVTLADARQGVDSVVSAKLEAHLAGLEKESIIKRIDRLFAICKPPEGYAPIGGYSFDRDRLAQIDERRHRIVHGQAYTGFTADGSDELEFMVKTGLFFFAMVNMRYNVKVNPLVALGIEPSNTGGVAADPAT